MVSECANPQCATPFLYFNRGSLLVLKARRRCEGQAGNNVEWFWLCERCAPWYEVWIHPCDDVARGRQGLTRQEQLGAMQTELALCSSAA